MKVIIIVLIILLTIYLFYKFKFKNTIEGNQNLNPELIYYKDKFQNLVNSLKNERKNIDKIENYYNAMDNIYKCLNFRYKIINMILEKERSGRANQASNAEGNLDSLTSEAPKLKNY